MIQDVDSSLRALLERELPQFFAEGIPNRVTISFEAPSDQFPPSSVSLPAVDFFLYDVRENLELRSNEWSLHRDSNGTAHGQRPPVRVDCSYLITAWASDGSNSSARDEHMLLGEVMIALLRFPKLPADILQERLRGQRLPLPSTVLQPGNLQSVGDFWQALGGKPKSALNYTVTIAVRPFELEEVPLAIESSASLESVSAEGATL